MLGNAPEGLQQLSNFCFGHQGPEPARACAVPVHVELLDLPALPAEHVLEHVSHGLPAHGVYQLTLDIGVVVRRAALGAGAHPDGVALGVGVAVGVLAEVKVAAGVAMLANHL